MIEKILAVFYKLGFGSMPKSAAIEKLIAFLRKLGIEPTPEEVADILWYAAQKLPIASANDLSQKREPLVPSSESPTAPAESAKKPMVQSSTEKPKVQSAARKQRKEALKLYPTDKDNQWGGIPFRSPGASALPGALKLVRALRPLMRRVPSFHRVMLDEEATVHQIAQTDIWIPVQRPVSIPWLEVAVVLEYSSSMCLWQTTVQELRILLERQGAFRDVRLWHFDTSHQDEMILTTGTSSVKRSYRELINPAVPRVILVVTDCISSVWHNGKINQWLTAWGHEHPVALIQMLPQQLWSQTQVRTAHLLHVTAPYQGAPNKRLKQEARSPWLKMPSGVPTPILTLAPDFMSAWVQFIASPTDSKKMPALIFKQPKQPMKKSVKKTGASSTAQKPTAEQRFVAFKANASPTAFQLACLLAAAPLRLPIMRLVQKIMLPESQQVHLAEFFLSGLLRRIGTDKDFSEPDEIAYDFLEDNKGFDIRGKLLDMGLMPDAIQVQQLVSSYIAERYGQPNDFQTLLENPDSLTDITIDSQNQFFASVSIEVLRRLGGRYAKAASLLMSEDTNGEEVDLFPFEFEVVTVDRKGEIIHREQKQANYETEDLGNGVTLEMVYIPSGKFMMGSPENEEERQDNEGPQHQVTVPSFFMAKYPVTQAQWQAVMGNGNNPSSFKGENRPVEQVSWDEAVKFCQLLSEKTGKAYRLPSEAEWEYACRAGTTTPFYFGETITTDLVNYNYERKKTTDVGSFPPNAFGLYDMHGNVWEWCADPWHKNYEGAPADGSVWKEGGKEGPFVLRGGSWGNGAGRARSANRSGGSRADRDRNHGFRLARLL
jgi:formylglycine-generating enzyme required for sulfatase activity